MRNPGNGLEIDRDHFHVQTKLIFTVPTRKVTSYTSTAGKCVAVLRGVLMFGYYCCRYYCDCECYCECDCECYCECDCYDDCD